MKKNSKIRALNVTIGIILIGLAISKFSLFGVETNPIIARTLFILIGLLYVFRFLLKQNRKPLDLTKMILVFLWSIFSSHLLSRYIGFTPHITLLAFTGITWLTQEFIVQIKIPKKINEFNWLRNVGVAILIIQFLFMIQQWPFAGPIMILATLGYIIVGISFIKEQPNYR